MGNLAQLFAFGNGFLMLAVVPLESPVNGFISGTAVGYRILNRRFPGPLRSAIVHHIVVAVCMQSQPVICEESETLSISRHI